MSGHSYQIDPHPADLGCGWRLRLLDSGEEVDGGVFPLPEYAMGITPSRATARGSTWMYSWRGSIWGDGNFRGSGLQPRSGTASRLRFGINSIQ